MQGGELSVVDVGLVSLQLQSHPSKVDVYFNSEPQLIPCNPSNYEFLNFSIVLIPVGSVNEFHLEISWKVNGFRSIKWEVFY